MKNDYFKEVLQWRYSVKEFDRNQKINESDWSLIEKTMQFAPSSYGLQPWKFIVVNDENIKEKLKKFTVNPIQIQTCSHLVVFCVLKNMDESYVSSWIDRVALERNTSVEALQTYKSLINKSLQGRTMEENFYWNKAQVYLALGFTLHAAASMKIDSCPIEGINIQSYNQILDIEKQGYSAALIAAFGYRWKNDKHSNWPKARFSQNDVIIRI